MTGFFHRQRLSLDSPVNHRMAVRTQGDQPPERSQGPDVVNMEHVHHMFSQNHSTCTQLSGNGYRPDGLPVPFIGIDRDTLFRPFNEVPGYGPFFREMVYSESGIPHCPLFRKNLWSRRCSKSFITATSGLSGFGACNILKLNSSYPCRMAARSLSRSVSLAPKMTNCSSCLMNGQLHDSG